MSGPRKLGLQVGSRTETMRFEDPHGHLARHLNIPWQGPDSTLEVTARGTPQQIHDFREYIARLAAGEAA